MAATQQPNTVTPARRGRPARDWTAIDEALAALPDPLPYGALSALATRLGVPAATVYTRIQARRSTDRAACAAIRQRRIGRARAGAAAPENPAGSAGSRLPAPSPPRLDPARCPVPGCPGARTILADPHQMPTLPLAPTLIDQAGSLGMCDQTPPHYSWVGAAGTEVLDLDADPG